MLPRFSRRALSVRSPASVTPLAAFRPAFPYASVSSSAVSCDTGISPSKETEAVTRIERLMALGDQLSKGVTDHKKPARLRGSGPYSAVPPPEKRTPKEDLPPLPTERKMSDSYVELDLRFSEDPALREQYVGGNTGVRMGRLMEAAYRHVLPSGMPISAASDYGFYLVTAAVDRLDMLRPLADASGSIPDLRLSGHVSYATESTVEVFMRMATIPASAEEKPQTILIGRFAMACRAATGGKQKIAQLIVEGPEQEELFRMGKEMKEGKKERAKQSLEKIPPNAKEVSCALFGLRGVRELTEAGYKAAMMHEIFMGRQDIYERNAATPSDVVWMSDTRINSALLMHPQERNVHNKVFGGYLMRLAYETAFSTACLFAQTPVTFISLDELQFALPVEIGSLLLLDSRVTFSPLLGDHKSFHVSVEAGTTDLRSGEKRVTNTFHFTFASDQTLKRHVLPRSYRQAMQWLDAQRRRELGIAVRKSYN
ncbi:acyl-CoA thioester hydrolase [Pseudohyphozyma bogoriensis]|nr:acyl-CoA thioester hydrolase [Pseudohyphozyma bogoriensis]